MRFNFESNFSYANFVSLGRLVCLAVFHFPHWKIKVQTTDFIFFGVCGSSAKLPPQNFIETFVGTWSLLHKELTTYLK